MAKPNKRQKAIVEFLTIINREGLDYAVTKFGVETVLEKIDDSKLIKLVGKYYKAAKKLESTLEELKQEVIIFMPDRTDD